MTTNTLRRSMKTYSIKLNDIGFTFQLWKSPLAVTIEGDFVPFEGDFVPFFWNSADKQTLREACDEYDMADLYSAISSEYNAFKLEEIVNYENELFIINRNTPYQPYVVCWNFTGTEWDCGTYCDTLDGALAAFNKKKAKRWGED